MDVLLLLAHADDETLGAGGLVCKLSRKGHTVRLIVVSDAVVAMRPETSDNRLALDKACQILGIKNYHSLRFRDQQFDSYPVAQIANAISEKMGTPDLIITHSPKDLNRDHRQVYEAAMIVTRPRGRQISVITCEIPFVATWNQQPFRPQLFVDISETLEEKIKAFEAYSNEIRTFPDPYSSEGLRTLARYRGMESGYSAAEGFEVIRMFPNILSL
ncbi:MAG: PIG-L deacetylase family protein [Bacteroidia bacterium]|nr:PIG-L deacetylase family protein [Bacteroidia bacterium]